MGEGAHRLHSVLSALLPGSVQLQGNCEPVSESPEENRQNQRLEKFTYEERWTKLGGIILEKKCWSVFKHIATLWRRGREKIWSLMRITPKNIVLKLFYLSKSSMVDYFFNCNWASCTLTFSSTLPQSLPCCRVYKKKYLSALVTYTTLTFVSGILPDPNCD